VLDHVREAALILVLENRAGIHYQSQLGPLLRLVVFADVVAHAVRQDAAGNGGIERKRAVDRCLGAGGLRDTRLGCADKRQRW